MCGNLDRRPIGKCSRCGGVVSIPLIWFSIRRPVPSCESCGAVADETANLPVIPMRPKTLKKIAKYKPHGLSGWQSNAGVAKHLRMISNAQHFVHTEAEKLYNN